MSVAQKREKWTDEEFFAWHELQEERYELIAGYPVLKWPPVEVLLDGQSAPTMMTGASRRHNQIAGNLFRRVADQLDGGNCKAFISDAAVRTAVSQFRYPDVVVDCGTKLDDGYVFEYPRFVAEVLSPSTRSFDLAGKVTEYWGIETLSYVLIVDPEQRRAQLHTRRANETPQLAVFLMADDLIDLAEIGVTLRLGDIFAGLPPLSERK